MNTRMRHCAPCLLLLTVSLLGDLAVASAQGAGRRGSAVDQDLWLPQLLARRVVAFRGTVVADPRLPKLAGDRDFAAVARCVVENRIYGAVGDTVDVLVHNFRFTGEHGQTLVNFRTGEPCLIEGDHVVIICAGTLGSATSQHEASVKVAPLGLALAWFLLPTDESVAKGAHARLGAYRQIGSRSLRAVGNPMETRTEESGPDSTFVLEAVTLDGLEEMVRAYYEGNEAKRIAACE